MVAYSVVISHEWFSRFYKNFVIALSHVNSRRVISGDDRRRRRSGRHAASGVDDTPLGYQWRSIAVTLRPQIERRLFPSPVSVTPAA